MQSVVSERIGLALDDCHSTCGPVHPGLTSWGIENSKRAQARRAGSQISAQPGRAGAQVEDDPELRRSGTRSSTQPLLSITSRGTGLSNNSTPLTPPFG